MWYAASLLFKGVHTPARDEPLWEESIRLIKADTEGVARDKAQRLGEAQKISYRTSEGNVAWTFERVERICLIETASIDDGTELFSRFLRDSEVKSMLIPFDDE